MSVLTGVLTGCCGRETHPDWCVEKGKTLVGKAS